MGPVGLGLAAEEVLIVEASSELVLTVVVATDVVSSVDDMMAEVTLLVGLETGVVFSSMAGTELVEVDTGVVDAELPAYL